jgi:hypothetical protein
MPLQRTPRRPLWKTRDLLEARWRPSSSPRLAWSISAFTPAAFSIFDAEDVGKAGEDGCSSQLCFDIGRSIRLCLVTGWGRWGQEGAERAARRGGGAVAARSHRVAGTQRCSGGDAGIEKIRSEGASCERMKALGLSQRERQQTQKVAMVQ